MSSLPSSLLARWPVVQKSTADTAALTFTSVLSAPYPDLAGDIVEPGGLNFRTHAADPSIDLEHARTNLRTMPIAWSRPTLAKAGPYHAPKPTRLNFGTDAAPEYHTVPVGTEWFDPACRVSMQVFALCEQDALPGRSLEFAPVAGFAKAIGRSPLENRAAYRFSRADVIRWTICAQPVCPQAMSVTKAVPQVPQPLAKILYDKRINVGGRFEALHPRILKALAPADGWVKPNTIRVEKAMEDELPADQTESTLEAETQGPEDAAPAKPTVQAHYDVSQGILDLIGQAEMALESSEHVKGKTFLIKKLEMMRGLAEDIKGMGDKIDGELSGGIAEEAAAESGEDAEPTEDTPPDMGTDDDGVLKAVRPVYRKSMKRFTLAEIRKAQEQASEDDPAKLSELNARIERAQKTIRLYS